METKRFVILEHFEHGVHYDLMFEVEGVLKTWRLERLPEIDAPQAARVSFDHRLLYLNHEGPISGDRGHVVRWDRGEYQGTIESNAESRLRLYGDRLQGEVLLRPMDDLLWEVTFLRGGEGDRPS